MVCATTLSRSVRTVLCAHVDAQDCARLSILVPGVSLHGIYKYHCSNAQAPSSPHPFLSLYIPRFNMGCTVCLNDIVTDAYPHGMAQPCVLAVRADDAQDQTSVLYKWDRWQVRRPVLVWLGVACCLVLSCLVLSCV